MEKKTDEAGMQRENKQESRGNVEIKIGSRKRENGKEKLKRRKRDNREGKR